MGSFTYLCKHCGTPIVGDYDNGGEKCVLIHVRHGKELGRVVGHYNEYGTVVEEDKSNPSRFRGEEGINSHDELHESESLLLDSIGWFRQYRFYQGEWRNYKSYLTFKASEIEDIEKAEVFAELSEYSRELVNKFEAAEDRRFFAQHGLVEHWELNHTFWKEFLDLPEYKSKEGLAISGIAVYHHKCYAIAEKNGTLDLLPSDDAPDDSIGTVRKKYK